MSETEQNPNPNIDKLRSIEILTSLQDCDSFQQDRQDRDRICLLYYTADGDSVAAREYYSKEDFYNAVDYYYENRNSELMVNLQMTKPDGVVEVYSPDKGARVPRHVVVRLKNYMVPQILEFAYLLLSQEQKKA
ncbi:hypothetical protein HYW46_03505 [Candidatus Daviesbacteria bacterium]|nr:hypothetical protein [Candidatus Daviesbacteria bacterium]